ncbi:MAG: hypothetical protein J6Q77_01355 [Clostridia bacterium]|nr:hypothetical protein [Clostridia bacterium]
MKVIEKLYLDVRGLEQHGPINIVIFGDSVSHGAVNGYIDYENVYWNQLKKKLNQLRDYMPINMINASIGGVTAQRSIPRLQNQVLKHEPDLIIVAFGLNDVNGTLEDYLGSLRTIFSECLADGRDVIFMTPNMLNTRFADDTPTEYAKYAVKTAAMQNEGRMDRYIYAAADLAREMGVTVCDCYSKWKEISKTQDVTMLLANRINHPIPEMHKLFADSLYDIIVGEKEATVSGDDTMFKE